MKLTTDQKYAIVRHLTTKLRDSYKHQIEDFLKEVRTIWDEKYASQEIIELNKALINKVNEDNILIEPSDKEINFSYGVITIDYGEKALYLIGGVVINRVTYRKIFTKLIKSPFDGECFNYTYELPIILPGATKKGLTNFINKESSILKKLAILNEDSIVKSNAIYNSVEQSLKCINTDTKLKAEFPEAYEIYRSMTQCDNIEKTRALLKKSFK
ncbi:MAG: hypothetical protein EOL97_15000 [Spirochaetia bacterium]|nr:hypothetical protein [Spirochaetia bacterium]